MEQKPPERKKETICLSLSPEVIEFLRKTSKDHGISVSSFVELVLRNFGPIMVDRLKVKRTKKAL